MATETMLHELQYDPECPRLPCNAKNVQAVFDRVQYKFGVGTDAADVRRRIFRMNQRCLGIFRVVSVACNSTVDWVDVCERCDRLATISWSQPDFIMDRLVDVVVRRAKRSKCRLRPREIQEATASAKNASAQCCGRFLDRLGALICHGNAKWNLQM